MPPILIVCGSWKSHESLKDQKPQIYDWYTISYCFLFIIDIQGLGVGHQQFDDDLKRRALRPQAEKLDALLYPDAFRNENVLREKAALIHGSLDIVQQPIGHFCGVFRRGLFLYVLPAKVLEIGFRVA